MCHGSVKSSCWHGLKSLKMVTLKLLNDFDGPGKISRSVQGCYWEIVFPYHLCRAVNPVLFIYLFILRLRKV